MAKHASEPKRETPADIQKAVELVSELAADACAKRDAWRKLQDEFQKAEDACTEADFKLRAAEDSLLKAARQHKPEKPEPEKA